MMVIIYVPFLNGIFNLTNLDFYHELIAFGLAFCIVIVVEIVKIFIRLKSK